MGIHSTETGTDGCEVSIANRSCVTEIPAGSVDVNQRELSSGLTFASNKALLN